MGDAGDKLTKAERLAVAGYAAPRLRADAERTRSRRVARVDADGKVVGYTTVGALQDALFKAQALEMETQDGVRPKTVVCEYCGKPVKVIRPSGSLPRVCRSNCAQSSCAQDDCNETPPPGSFTTRRVRMRKGRPWMCGRHNGQRNVSSAIEASKRLGRKERQDAARKGAARRDPSERSETARRVASTKTAEERSAAAKRRQAALTPEQRSEATRKGMAGRTPQQRSETVRARQAKKTPEERSETVRKAWATRRANAAKKTTDTTPPKETDE